MLCQITSLVISNTIKGVYLLFLGINGERLGIIAMLLLGNNSHAPLLSWKPIKRNLFFLNLVLLGILTLVGWLGFFAFVCGRCVCMSE